MKQTNVKLEILPQSDIVENILQIEKILDSKYIGGGIYCFGRAEIWIENGDLKIKAIDII